MRFPCGLCGRHVRINQKAIQCEICLKWLHCKCLNISSTNYSILQQDNNSWCCPSCYRSALPFADCSDITKSNPNSNNTSFIDQSLNTSHLSSNPSPTIFNSISNFNSLGVENLSNISASDIGNLRVYYCNGRSLLPKIDELKVLVTISKPDIITIVETWLDQDILDSEVSIQDYRIFRRDRSRHGGGLVIYINENLCVKSHICCINLEMISVVLTI